MGRAKICGRREVKTGLKGIDMLHRRTKLKVCVSKRKSYNKIYLSLMSEAVEGTRKTLKETEGQSI
ncbi:hypothetical protein OUZ56_004400 [Daphnia magna]|uniref:Uncharacterized protein n=1 Tax=Daphnia magna TaxID=35525 RepID=A0ABQ9YPQ8_9CRUS|nr:hypothetical protein OUZ56_004400 [Daphnia magna]